MASNIRAILFDMDGVLVSAKEWHFEALNRALAECGYRPIGREAHRERFDGLSTRRKLALLADEQPIPATQFEAINALKQRYTREISEANCVENTRLIATLDALRREGFAMAVCSNSVRASVDLLLAQSGIAAFFAFTLSNEDVTHPKPHPEIYQCAMARLGVAPREALILEDNPHGIRSARASGAHVLEIGEMGEVNYPHIMAAIAGLEKAASCA